MVRSSASQPELSFSSAGVLRLWLVLVWLLACPSGRGELVLTNYTSARPLKVMPSGDSITDDCSINGAYRPYLQPLLATTGYAFTNVGRWISSASPGFTMTHHEGICGAVIAWPGMFGYHGYSTLSNYTQNTLQDALKNTTPDLFLIDLGVNDIGYGRNPYLVATNHMAALLDLIFTTAPSAHIIVGKPTTISRASIGSPPYSTYGANMPIFCAALQALVNARQALGQNVFIADLFSAVDANTMLQSDGTHPNAAGFRAMAGEWLFRIDALTVRTDRVVTAFIGAGSTWKYSDQGLDLGTNWVQPGYDDSAWAQGPGRLGYNAPGISSVVSYGPSSTNKNITTYFRRPFVAPTGVHYTNLSLRLNRACGAVVWLNGQELLRTNLPPGPISYQSLATAQVSGDYLNTYFPANLAIPSLPAGTNLVAVEIHHVAASFPYLTFDMELFGVGEFDPGLTTSLNGTDSLGLFWPTGFAGFNLETSTGLSPTNVWQTVSGPYIPSNGTFGVSVPLTTGPQQFFRLRKPLP